MDYLNDMVQEERGEAMRLSNYEDPIFITNMTLIIGYVNDILVDNRVDPDTIESVMNLFSGLTELQIIDLSACIGVITHVPENRRIDVLQSFCARIINRVDLPNIEYLRTTLEEQHLIVTHDLRIIQNPMLGGRKSRKYKRRKPKSRKYKLLRS